MQVVRGLFRFSKSLVAQSAQGVGIGPGRTFRLAFTEDGKKFSLVPVVDKIIPGGNHGPEHLIGTGFVVQLQVTHSLVIIHNPRTSRSADASGAAEILPRLPAVLHRFICTGYEVVNLDFAVAETRTARFLIGNPGEQKLLQCLLIILFLHVFHAQSQKGIDHGFTHPGGSLPVTELPSFKIMNRFFRLTCQGQYGNLTLKGIIAFGDHVLVSFKQFQPGTYRAVIQFVQLIEFSIEDRVGIVVDNCLFIIGDGLFQVLVVAIITPSEIPVRHGEFRVVQDRFFPMLNGLFRLFVVQNVSNIVVGFGVLFIKGQGGFQYFYRLEPEGKAPGLRKFLRTGIVFSCCVGIAHLAGNKSPIIGDDRVLTREPSQYVFRLGQHSFVQISDRQLHVILIEVPHFHLQVRQDRPGILRSAGLPGDQVKLIDRPEIERIALLDGHQRICGIVKPPQFSQRRRLQTQGPVVARVGGYGFVDLMKRPFEITPDARYPGQLEIRRSMIGIIPGCAVQRVNRFVV